jgi:glycosyltransferase involved in cell wall biosynthesis
MPKVSVIIPVYNVEKYLHACLDSVVNQTLTDIQIICVDDGSPDCCPQILDEYAAKDQRITVIHQQNAGVSAARNTAYPFLNGEYTLFVDSDDTIEPNLCERAVAVADAEQADTTYFFMDRGPDSQKEYVHGWSCKMQKLTEKHLLTENDYAVLLKIPTVWAKLWRTCFLRDNNIQCPVGQVGEDTFVQWKTLLCNPKIALLPEVMYHYRNNPLSFMHEPSQKYVMGVPVLYDLIKAMLQEIGHYHSKWKHLFLNQKLIHLRAVYCHVPAYLQKEYLRMVKDRIGSDDREYLSQKNELKRQVKVFYFALLGSRFAAVENAVYITLRNAENMFRKFRNQWKRA